MANRLAAAISDAEGRFDKSVLRARERLHFIVRTDLETSSAKGKAYKRERRSVDTIVLVDAQPLGEITS